MAADDLSGGPCGAEEFMAMLSDALCVAGPLTLSIRLVEDLGLSSIDHMELLALLNEWGAPVSTEVLLSAVTVGDVLAGYERAIAESDEPDLGLDGARADGRPWPDGAERRAPLLAHPLVSGRLRLRPVMRNDYDVLYHLACDPETGRRWRLGGATPIFDVFIRRLSEDVLTQFVVELRGPDVPGGLGAVGLVQAYRPSAHGHAHLASLLRDDLMGRGIAMEAMALFVEHLFRNFGLRYLFAEVPGYNLPFLGEGRKGGRLVFEEYGRMPEFEFAGGCYWDLHILGISRASWEAEIRPRIAPVVARRPQRSAPQGRAGGAR